MNKIKEFAAEVKNRLFEALPEIDVEEIEISEVIKNNDQKLTGIRIVEKGNNIAPVIYLNNWYEQYTEGKNLDIILAEIRSCYLRNKPEKDAFDVSWFENWEEVKQRVRLKVINLDFNKERLAGTLYRTIADLAICAYISVQFGGNNGDITVEKAHLKSWGITEDDFFKTAYSNMEQEEFWIDGIGNILAETGFDVPEGVEDAPMMVASNKKKYFGASVLTNKAFLEKIAERLGDGYFIIPSSIHEVICLPDDVINRDEIKEMIQAVNTTEVSPEEVLSNNLYYFSKEEGLTVA